MNARDDHRIRIPWLNFLTAQSIPEETDTCDYSKRQHTDSGCSTSSSEDSYVVLEVQRPRSILTEQELNFENVHYVESNQIARSMIIETPAKENAMEYSSESMIDNQDLVAMTEISLIEHHCKPSTPTISHPSKSTTFTRTFAFDQACMKKLHNLEQLADLTSKPPALLRLLRRHIKSGYELSMNEIPTAEPSLFQLKYLDGRPTLIDPNALKFFEHSPRFNLSYRKRFITRLQAFLKSSPTDRSKAWQSKTKIARN